MAFVPPRTWTPTEWVTAALLNTHLRDNLNALWVGTTPGDLDYYASATTKSRLGIGAAGKVLTPVAGVPAWGLLSDVTFPASMYLNAAQSIPSGIVTQIVFQAANFDPKSCLTLGAGAKYTAPLTGYYHIDVQVDFVAITLEGAEQANVAIYVNGALRTTIDRRIQPAYYLVLFVGGGVIIQMNAGDTVDMRAYQNTGGAIDLADTHTYVSIARVG